MTASCTPQQRHSHQQPRPAAARCTHAVAEQLQPPPPPLPQPSPFCCECAAACPTTALGWVCSQADSRHCHHPVCCERPTPGMKTMPRRQSAKVWCFHSLAFPSVTVNTSSPFDDAECINTDPRSTYRDKSIGTLESTVSHRCLGGAAKVAIQMNQRTRPPVGPRLVVPSHCALR